MLHAKTRCSSTPSRRRSTRTALAVLTLLLGVVASVATTAVQPAGASVVTQAATFTSALNCTSWVPAVAPPGAISATFTVIGGGGASGDSRSTGLGGNGGRASSVAGTVTVAGGQRLWAVIGCGGNGWDAGVAKGYADGGDPGSANGGGGGGASALCLGTAVNQCVGGAVVAIAAGGGGGGGGTRNASDGGTANNGGAGADVSTATSGTALGGNTRAGNNGANGGGGQNGTGGTGASAAGVGGAGGLGARGNVSPGSPGGSAPTSSLPPVALSTQGTGGRAMAVQDRSGGGGGGGLAGGGAGGSGQAQLAVDWNSGSGGGAGASWVKTSVTGQAFGQGATLRDCGSAQSSRNPANATDAGAGSNTFGGHGCSGWVSVTWSYENTTVNPAVTTTNNTWSYSPTLSTTCGSTQTLALPTSATSANVIASGGGGGGGGGGANNAYGGAGAPGDRAAVSGFSLRSGGALLGANLNYTIGCAGGPGASADPGPVTGGAGGAGFGNGAKGGDGPNGGNRTNSGGGGGGGTGVCVGAASTACTSGTQIAAAGGGGGGGGSSYDASDRLSHGGNQSSGVGTSTINSDNGQAGQSRGGYGGSRGRRGSGGGGGGGGAGGSNLSDNDNSVNGTAGAGNGTAGTGGTGRRTQGNPVAANGSGHDGGAGGVHTGGSTRRSGGGGGGGGFRGGGGGGSDEENGGSLAAGGGGSGSSWGSTVSVESTYFSNGNGGAGGSPGAFDGSAAPLAQNGGQLGNAPGQGSVSVTLFGDAITFTGVTNQSSPAYAPIANTSPVTMSFQDPSGAATCGCTWSATGLPTGLTMNTAGVVSGTPTAVGTFSNVVVTVVSSGSVYTNVTSPFTWTITFGAASKLAFTQSPNGGGSGAVWTTQPKVTIQDQGGNTVTNNTSSVTLAIKAGSPAGGVLTCTSNPIAAVAGIATFAGCKIDGPAGTYTLTATDGALTSADSTSFPITVGAATKLAFSVQPGGGESGQNLTTQPSVVVQDSGGNTVTSATNPVTLAVTGGAATIACTANPKAAVSGVAAFAACKVTGPANTYTLTATSPGLTAAVSNNFAVTVSLPIANPQTTSARRAFATAIQLTGSDPNNQPLTYAVSTQPTKGIVNCNSSGACTYTAGHDQIGDDTFAFTVNNGTYTSAPATVTIHITNDAPVANALDVGVATETAVNFTLTGSDANGDTLTFQTQSPLHGQLTGTGANRQYVSDTGFTGVDTFTFTVTDVDSAVSAPATVRIYVGVAKALNGTVTSTVGGTPLPGIEARLVDNTDPQATDPALLATAVTNASGVYDLAPLLPDGVVPYGDYVIRFVDPANNYLPEWNLNAANRATATNIGVASLTVGVSADLVPAARITGTLTSTAVGHPGIDGLQVRLFKIGSPGSSSTTTASGGQYSFGLLKAGDYQLWFRDVSSGQWVSEWYDEQPTQATAATITLTVGQQLVVNEDIAPVNAPPQPVTANITGTVTSSVGGAPIAGIQVRLYKAPYTTSAAMTTDANGHYVFPNQATGSYKIWFRVVSGNAFVSEYYNDKPDLASADVIVVDGALVTADAALSPPPPPPVRGTISGTVTQGGSTPIAGIQVRLYPDGGSSSATTTDGNGQYSFPNLVTGSYKLYFRDLNGTYVSEYYVDKADLTSADPVAVNGATVTADADLALKAPVPPANTAVVSGTVTQLDGVTPIAGIQVRLYVSGSATGSVAATTAADGTYSFVNKAPGDYQLWFRDLSGLWVSEWNLDKASQATADPVAATNGSTTTVDASLTPR